MAAAGLGFWDGESPGPESGVPGESGARGGASSTVELGNDVNAVTDYGDTPIEGDPAALLHRHPLNLSQFDDSALGDMRWGGSTALHGAAIRGADSIITFLVEHGARVDARNKLGWTPLTTAQGVFVANTEKAWPTTIALLKALESQNVVGEIASGLGDAHRGRGIASSTSTMEQAPGVDLRAAQRLR